MKSEKQNHPDSIRFPEEQTDWEDLLTPEEDEDDPLYHRSYPAPEEWDEREFHQRSTSWN